MSNYTVRPLIYNQALTRFPHNTSLSTIVKELMIEQWNPLPSYDLYWQACAPTYCTYSHTEYVNNFVGIVVQIVSAFGGVIAALRIITPRIVTFFIYLFTPTVRRQQQVRSKLFDRLKVALSKVIRFLYTSSINLNIFPLWAFGSNTNQVRAKRLGQWATRLYIVLLTISLAIIILYTGLRPQILTKNFNKPSFNVYNDLVRDHGDTLQCSCSSISSTYDQFVQIEPVFHQVCSSTFVLDTWHKNLVAGLAPGLSIYNDRDYRRFLSAHLQFLTGLCQLSIKTINSSVHQFLSSSLVTNKILQKTTFYSRINSLINQSKSSAPAIFTRLLFLVQATNHANAIISAYGTNFVYMDLDLELETYESAILWTQAVIYDNECSCGLNTTCTIQANFIKNNSSEIIPIKGFKMGCTPSESFLESTLECFYDFSCINLILEQTNYNNNSNTTMTPVPLLPTTNGFPINTTMKDLIRDLFIEDWSTMINYSSYFEQCSPSVCSYTYIQQLNSIYTVTFLFSICGGLMVVLKWICPILVRLMIKARERMKGRTNLVQPALTISTAPIETTNTISDPIHVDNAVDNLELVSTIPPPQTRFPPPLLRTCKIVFWFILFMILVVVIITPFFNLILKEKNQTVSAVSSTNTTTIASTTTSTTTTTSTSSTVPTCQLTFQSIFIYTNSPFSTAVGDFNGDHQLDLVVANVASGSVGVLLGNGNGSFDEPMVFVTGDASDPQVVITADFNDDGHLDIAVSTYGALKVGILLGNGNGTFREAITYSIGNYGYSLWITTGDINGDDHLDIAVTNVGLCNIGVLFGYGNGTFAAQITFWTGNTPCFMSVVLGNFNNDSQLDIAFTFTEYIESQVGILLGYGNGTFRAPMIFSTGNFNFPWSIIAHDFNRDGYLDIAVSNTGNDNVGVLLGKGDGTFQAQTTFSTGRYSAPMIVVTGDFNGDGELDLSIPAIALRNVGVLLGYGNGTFETQMTFSTGSDCRPMSLVVGDFNNDSRLDLVATCYYDNAVAILLNTCECCVSEFLNTSTFTHQ